MKKTLFLVAIAVILAAPVMAFHDEGVAHCNGCHTMHNSEGGVAMNFQPDGTPGGSATGTGFDDLLLYENKTDLCLECHDGEEAYHVWSDDPAAPSYSALRGGGDFVFLEEDNINEGHGGSTDPILGHETGHNVVSIMKGTVDDPAYSMSPGGSYPDIDMACTSCHDPHGNQGFRLTYQLGQQTTSDTGHVINWTTTMVADGIGTRDGAETGGNHNAYKSGYSAWCGTCHGDFHANSGNLIHPSGELFDTRQIAVYNSYNGTTDCVNNPPGLGTPCGTQAFATAYLAEVPFEDSTMTISATKGATAGQSYVACVSCHRAHATSAQNAGRWDFNVTGLAEDGHESGSYPIPNPFDGNQRSLCNKCHSQDEYDTLVDFTP